MFIYFVSVWVTNSLICYKWHLWVTLSSGRLACQQFSLYSHMSYNLILFYCFLVTVFFTFCPCLPAKPTEMYFLRPSYDWMRNLSVRHPPSNSASSSSSSSVLSHHGSTAATRRVTLVFNNIQPAELAEQLTFLEYKAFRRIMVRMKRMWVHLGLYATHFRFFPDVGFWHFTGL